MWIHIRYGVNTQTTLSQMQSGNLGRNKHNYTIPSAFSMALCSFGSTWTIMILIQPIFVRDFLEAGTLLGVGNSNLNKTTTRPSLFIICNLSSVFCVPFTSLTCYLYLSYLYLFLVHCLTYWNTSAVRRDVDSLTVWYPWHLGYIIRAQRWFVWWIKLMFKQLVHFNWDRQNKGKL